MLLFTVQTTRFGIKYKEIPVSVAAEHIFLGSWKAVKGTSRNFRGQREESISRFQVENDGIHSSSRHYDCLFTTDRNNLHTNHLTNLQIKDF